MTMLSFRVSPEDAERLRLAIDQTGASRSAFLKDALRRRLDQLAGERDAERWQAAPPSDAEQSFAGIADWGPAEDWSDWG